MVSRPPRHRMALARDRKRPSIGVEDAFWVHWGENEPFLLRLCMGWLRGTPLDAQEVLSSGMLKAWDAAQSTVEEIGNYRAWLAKVLRNHCIDQQRKLARDLQVRAVTDLQMTAVDRHPGNQLPSPEAMLLRDESYHWLLAGMEVLPERLREVMILRATQDMAYEEIGKRLHISGDNARKRVQLARERLRRQAPLPGTEVPEHEQEVTEAILAQERLDLGPAPCHAEPVAVCLEGTMFELVVYHRYRPSRLQQKTDTVARYLTRHDAGWRKECEYIQLLWALGDVHGAMERMDAARLRHADIPELTVVQLRMLANIGAWQRVGEVAALSIEGGESEEIHGLLRGFVAMSAGEHGTAFQEFEALGPALRSPFLTMAAIEAGEMDRARTSVREWLSLRPTDREAWMAELLTATAEERHVLAAAGLRRFPHDPFAQALSLVCWQMQGRFGETEDAKLQRLARRLPGTFLLVATKAAILWHQGDGATAARIVGSFLKQNPQHIQAQRFAKQLAQLQGKAVPGFAQPQGKLDIAPSYHFYDLLLRPKV